MLMNVAKACYAQNFFTGDYKKIDKKFSARLFRCVASQVPTLVLVSQEITKLDNKFSVRLFSQGITISQELFSSLLAKITSLGYVL